MPLVEVKNSWHGSVSLRFAMWDVGAYQETLRSHADESLLLDAILDQLAELMVLVLGQLGEELALGLSQLAEQVLGASAVEVARLDDSLELVEGEARQIDLVICERRGRSRRHCLGHGGRLWILREREYDVGEVFELGLKCRGDIVYLCRKYGHGHGDIGVDIYFMDNSIQVILS